MRNKVEQQTFIEMTPLGEFLAKRSDPVQFRVDGLLIDIGTSLWCGKPKSGKTMLLHNLMGAVVDGLPFLGRETVPCDVGLISVEGPRSILLQHIEKIGIRQTHGKLFCFHNSMPKLDESGVQVLRNTLKQFPTIRLLIVDPIAKLLQVKDNNDYAEILRRTGELESLAKQHRVHIAFSVHAKKRESDDAGDGIIGSTAFRGSTDANFFLTKKGNERQICSEQRYDTPLELSALTYDKATCRIGLGNTVEAQEEETRKHKDQKTRQRIEQDLLDALLTKRRLTTELLDLVTGNQATKFAVLEDLENRGLVRCEEEGRAVYYSRPSLPEETKGAVAA